MVNKVVTLNVKTRRGVKHMRFECLKDLGNNKYILLCNKRLCIGEKISWGLWSISTMIDVSKPSMIELECEQLNIKQE